MQQEEFKILLEIIKRQQINNDLFNNCYNFLKTEKILIHDVGVFEKKIVLENLKNKIALNDLNVQKNNDYGITDLYSNLLLYRGDKIRQFVITTVDAGFLIIFSEDLKKAIGIMKRKDINMSKDLNYQLDLIKKGYPNNNISIFESGKFVGKI